MSYHSYAFNPLDLSSFATLSSNNDDDFFPKSNSADDPIAPLLDGIGVGRYKKEASQLTHVSEIVKEQLSIRPYAIINSREITQAEKNSHHLISDFISSIYSDESHTIPNDIIYLLHRYYPLFYWSDEYISLQCKLCNTNIFILPKECCELSGFLRSFISNVKASASTLNIAGISNNILEIVVKYIANMYYRKQRKECKPLMYYDDSDQLSVGVILDKQTLRELHEAAKKMDCASLAALTYTRLKSMQRYENHTHSLRIKDVLNSHFKLFLSGNLV